MKNIKTSFKLFLLKMLGYFARFYSAYFMSILLDATSFGNYIRVITLTGIPYTISTSFFQLHTYKSFIKESFLKFKQTFAYAFFIFLIFFIFFSILTESTFAISICMGAFLLQSVSSYYIQIVALKKSPVLGTFFDSVLYNVLLVVFLICGYLIGLSSLNSAISIILLCSSLYFIITFRMFSLNSNKTSTIKNFEFESSEFILIINTFIIYILTKIDLIIYSFNEYNFSLNQYYFAQKIGESIQLVAEIVWLSGINRVNKIMNENRRKDLQILTLKIFISVFMISLIAVVSIYILNEYYPIDSIGKNFNFRYIIFFIVLYGVSGSMNHFLLIHQIMEKDFIKKNFVYLLLFLIFTSIFIAVQKFSNPMIQMLAPLTFYLIFFKLLYFFKFYGKF